MKKLVVVCLAVAGLALAALPAQAWGHRRGCKQSCCESACAAPCAPSCAAPCAPAAPAFVEKVVTCYRPEWREKEVTCTVNRVVPRQVVEQHQCTVMVPVWKEEVRTVTSYTSVPRQVEREVTVCHKVPVAPACGECGGCATACCDSGCGHHRHRLFGRHHRGGGDCGGCGGCAAPCYQTVTEVRKVVCTVMECVPVQKQVKVRVCSYRPEVKTYTTTRTVCECRPETVVRKVRYCVSVPYQTTVKVPVCQTCCASCCN